MRRLFGADGIRGLAGRYPLEEEPVERLGQALATWLRQSSTADLPRVLIGTDTRESGARLKAAFSRGLLETGVSIVDAGILPTPAISYLLASLGKFDAGVMISASHGPIIENGIKVMSRSGTKLEDGEESAIEDLFFRTDSPFPITRRGTLSRHDYSELYVQSLVDACAPFSWSEGTVLVDCANGAAYDIFPRTLAALQIPHVLVNASPDGTNANWDSGSEFVRLNPRRLAEQMRAHEATVGITVDGDADRVLLVDPEGRLYDGDIVLAMLALKFQSAGRLSKSTVVATTMSNSGLDHFLQERGIEIRRVGSGDKYVTDELLRHGLLLGAEQIGHVIIHTDEAHVTGDGIRTALFVLRELAGRPGARLVDLTGGMRKWPQVKAGAYIGPGHWGLQPHEVPGLVELIGQARAEITDLTQFEYRSASTEPFYRVMIEARNTPICELATWARRIAAHVQSHFGCQGQLLQVHDCVDGGLIGTG